MDLEWEKAREILNKRTIPNFHFWQEVITKGCGTRERVR
jgi:hypothetical protein